MTRDEELSAIREELLTLPRGTVTYKRIKGRDQPYLQWSEGGKTKSRYLKLSERDLIIHQVERRRSLESRLRQIMEEPLSQGGYGLAIPTSFEMNVLTGRALEAMGRRAAGLQRRDCYRALQAYLADDSPRVCALYGLRRTGKTTMLAQSVADMKPEQRERAAYVKCRLSDDMGTLNRDLRRLQALGFQYVLVDEVTLLEDFITDSAVLSDVYCASGMRIVLTGTDSLSFWLAGRDELYDRAVTIHTTVIPFREHSRLLGTHDIDDYIAFGGTLRQGARGPAATYADEDLAFADNESARVYIDTAISRNIQRSLAFYEGGGHFGDLAQVYRADELTSAINRIVEDMGHRFLRQVVMGPFRSHDYGVAARNLRGAKDPDRCTPALDYLDRASIARRLMAQLDILDVGEHSVIVSEAHLLQLHDYLRRLDLLAECPVNVVGGSLSPSVRTVVTQPGMRYCQAVALVQAIVSDPDFADLSARERRVIIEAVSDDIRGRMLEDIVLHETVSACPHGKRAFELVFERADGLIGEFDLAVYDEEEDCCDLYEVKHSSSREPAQRRHLLDEEALSLVSRTYGRVRRRTVLYRGEDAMEDGISYNNVCTYLLSL